MTVEAESVIKPGEMPSKNIDPPRSCTCHPDDRPTVCQKQHALSACNVERRVPMTAPNQLLALVPISAADREKAIALCNAATPGPWIVYPDGHHIGNPSWKERPTRVDHDLAAFSRTAIPSYEARVVELEAENTRLKNNWEAWRQESFKLTEASEARATAAEAEAKMMVGLKNSMQDYVFEQRARLITSEARATALLEALRPFAKMAPDLQEDEPEWFVETILSVDFCTPDGNATYGDLRAASAAIAQHSGSPE